MEEVRRITIRVAPELHNQLNLLADDQSVSLNSLAVDALETYVKTHDKRAKQLPLQELSILLAPAAEAADLTEEELLRHAREVRKRIWQERYEKAVHAPAGPAEQA